MPTGLYIVDFHAHLMTPAGVERICPTDQKNLFFRYIAPVLEQVAHLSEPLHDDFFRHVAMNLRDPVSRFVYACCGQVGLMETLRLFKTYNLERLLKSMDREGINHVVVCSLEPLTLTAELLELTSAHRDRISIFGSFSRDESTSADYLAPHIESGAVSGLKIHPVVGGYACGELYHIAKEMVALASERELPIVIHTGHIPVEALQGLAGCNEVKALEPLVSAFPRARFVLAHIGWESWRDVLRLAVKYPNVSVETSWQPARVIRRAVDALGPRRVLFGSDYPLFKQAQAIRQVRHALSPTEFVMVASTNAVRLLHLTRATDDNQSICV